MPIVLRKVDISDRVVQELIEVLSNECFEKGELVGDWRWTTGDWWVAVDGATETVGFAGMIQSTVFRKSGYLALVGVLPKYRRRGLMKRLVKKCIAAARSYGWKQIVTDVVCYNAASANALLGCGFKQFVPKTKWASEHASYWRVNLQ